MASNEQIVNSPVVAGLDLYTDDNNVKPPALIMAKNVTMRRPGSLEKRNGFSLVTGVSGQPASAFDGDSVPNPNIEALGINESASGERALLASGSKLYEFVGSDATHGWRTVNRLPEFIGTLNAVTSSGGSVIEIDSIPSNDGEYMFTAWLTGARTGQELSSDLAYANMTSASYNAFGNVLYYAVQKTSDGTFVVPPTVLQANTSAPLLNLRLTRLWVTGSNYNIIAAWQNGGSIQYKMYSFTSATLSAQYALGTTGQTCFRSFDVTGLQRSVLGTSAMVWATCPLDTSGAAPAALYAELVTVNPTTGAQTFNAQVLNIMAKAAPGAGTWYQAWAFRGIVLEQDPVAGEIAASARAITQYYSAPATATGKLDGQLWTVFLTAAPASLTVSANNAQIPFIGFQTEDDHDNVLAAITGTSHVSGTVQMLEPFATQVTPAPTLYTPSNLRTPFTITGQLPDLTFQTYVCSNASWSVFTGGASYVQYMTLSITGPNLAGYTTNLNQSVYGPAPAFPTPTHTYPQDAPQPITITELRQITAVDIASIAASLSGFTPGIHLGCPVYVGAVIVCYVAVFVNPAGFVTEIAIQDGLPGIVPTAGNPAVGTAITSITIPRAGPFVWPAGGLAYSSLYNSTDPLRALDAPSRTVRTTNTRYVQDGELEHCVHRWDVKSNSGVAFIALSSVSANLMTTPGGDAPFGAAEPHKQNNMFEVYRWNQSTDRLLVATNGSPTSSVMVGAVGGPWRMVGGLIKASSGNQLYCAICPGGDEYQRNTFLVRIEASNPFTISYAAQAKTDPGGEDYVYEGNPGLFVESCNMMRVTSAPLNLPSLRVFDGVGMSVAAMRDGSSRGTQDIFNISYKSGASTWRKLLQLSDYTFINGGTLSIFDGSSSYEATSLMWPQKDLTSINWPIVSPDVYIVTAQGSQNNVQNTFSANAFYDRTGTMGKDAYCVVNVTRPWFKYEAGLNDKNGFNNPLGCGWSYIKTFWGGEPSKNYETVYADPRVAQYNFGKASYANGWNAANEQKQHYYGRYQDTPRNFDLTNGKPFGIPTGGISTALYLWAPRSAAGWGNLQVNLYNPATAGGDFLMRWTYEYTDGTGRIVRSAPSNATQYTVCAEIQGDWYDASNANEAPEYTGGAVTEFRWGFFAPRLELTNRLKTAAADAQRVSLQPYTTAEPYSTVLYRMPLSSWSSPSASFVVNRNVTRGVVPYSLTPYTANTALGFVINNFSLFDGPQKDYNGLLSEPFIYTTGNVLDNVPPPSALAMCVHQNRLVMGGADDATTIWFSKELSPTEAPGFNDALTLQIDDGGAVTGLASIESALVVFKTDDIFVVAGTMPDSTGYAPSLSTPLKLPSGIGCIDHRSVIETPVGIFFQSTRTIELLKSSFEVEPVGLKLTGLNGFDNVTITSTAHAPETQEVYFTYYSNGNEAAIGFAVFNYALMAWVTWVVAALGDANFRVAVINGKPCIVCKETNAATASDQAFYYTQNPYWTDVLQTNTYSFVSMQILTAPFGLHEIQGYERLKRASVLTELENGSSVGAPGIVIANGGVQNNSLQQTPWTSAQVAELMTSTHWDGRFEVHVAEQKNRSLALGIVEDPATTPSFNNPNLRVSGFAFRIGLKAGFNKRTTETARR
jgi:hypothetical protein